MFHRSFEIRSDGRETRCCGDGYSFRLGWKNSFRLLVSMGPGFVSRETAKNTIPVAMKDTRNPFRLRRNGWGLRIMFLSCAIPIARNAAFIQKPTSVAAIAPIRVARFQ